MASIEKKNDLLGVCLLHPLLTPPLTSPPQEKLDMSVNLPTHQHFICWYLFTVDSRCSRHPCCLVSVIARVCSGGSHFQSNLFCSRSEFCLSTKLLRHFTEFILIRATINNVFNLPPPHQCCQCCCVVKTKSGKWQTPRNNIERGRGGIKYSLPTCKSRHS